MEKIKLNITLKRTIYVIIGAFIYAMAIELFFAPAKLYTAGFTGIAMMLSTFLKELGISLSTGNLILILNIPLFIISWRYIGRTFTFYTVLSIVLLSVFSNLIPIIPITDDRLMAAVFGGTFAGIGVAITLKAGASTGGTDIISLFMSFRTNKSFGSIGLVINGFIIFIAGAIFGWETALYTIINVYVSMQIVDHFNTRYKKLTVFIVTERKEEMIQALHTRIFRGVTAIEATGSYSGLPKTFLYTVITNYELESLREAVREIDNKAFVNITDSVEILGNFSSRHTKMD